MNKIGIIGGSALYEMKGMKILEKKKVSTPFGEPSDELVFGELGDKGVVFLPRHGRAHSISPSEINFRANIYALKVIGVDRVISVSAVGSLKEEIRPSDVLLVDQFVDRTNQGRPTTFFGDGIVAHVSMADPVCGELRQSILDNSRGTGAKVHERGIYLNMEGPAFSTRAESALYRSWGMDVIGMTNMQEARLAREAGMCYATIAMITDYDCWRTGKDAESVTIEMIIRTVAKNIDTAKKILSATIKHMPQKRSCVCGRALENAIFTPKEHVPQTTLDRLRPIIDGFI
ncbi:MAG: S-methyl-5'-thioadenosine phosphorylase [Candidatus Omnitrophota bacterium]|nr:S-methyl-5'-thioadenosine phosphorylase [Candidatus Omnitrophota bacterium]